MSPFRTGIATLVFVASVTSNLTAAEPGLADRIREDVTVLSADDMEGRGLGTKGLTRAASWIEGRLRVLGLQPAFERSYRQPFQVKRGVQLTDGNRLSDVAMGDWTPLAVSSPGEFSGELAFVGYGIEAPAVGYQDFAGVDLKGKVALMLRYEPQERDEASPFAGRQPSRWSALRYKVLQARERGAVAVVFVTGPMQSDDGDKLPALRNDGPESPAGLPVLQVRTAVARRWLAAKGVDLDAFQKSVDRDLTPRSIGSTGVKISGRVALEATYAEGQNVAGLLAGRGALASEYVVVGAHYDHLGMGGEGSMRPNVSAVHNGADDNASGTVAVLRAASMVQKSLGKAKNRRSILFVLFSGEESGLAGSSWMVRNLPPTARNIVAMINLDMVGQLREDQLAALGADSAPEWRAAIDRAAAGSALKINPSGDGYGPSDHSSFFSERIPVLHLFTGAHDRYHTPDDDADSLNYDGIARVAQFTAALTSDLGSGGFKPSYTRATTQPSMEGDGRGYGAWLGTVPDFTAMTATSGGVLLSDVRTGGPADLAGIRRGDRIISMAGTRIANLYDMTFALQDHKPGDTIEVVVVRDGADLKLRATLGSRKEVAAPSAALSATPKAAPAEVPPVAAPVNPHAGSVVPEEGAPKVNPFYANRPGNTFVIGAGKPFATSNDKERHLTEIRQLTFGGENAEAYFSPDGQSLIYQATTTPGSCDQQYILDLGTGKTTLVSGGKGRTTCGYFDFPEADRVIFASTVAGGDECPPPPDRSRGYVWPIYSSFDLYEAAPDGTGMRRLTDSPGYDAEATWCQRGGKLVFTSDRDGDLDLYEMNEAGDTKRLTDGAGYDGGAFFSPDCSQIVWRASRPTGPKLEEYRGLLAEGLVRPSEMELFVMSADGSGQKQITSNGAANFCPFFHPDGKRIIFASNAGSANGREFDLFMIPAGGGESERITFAEGFDGFPMWSPDGEYLVFASNRSNPEGRDTNLFIARWVD